MSNNYISNVTEVNDTHRSHFIIHDGIWYFAEFDTVEQLDFFANMLGFTYELTKEQPQVRTENGIYKEFSVSHKFVECKSFWKHSEIPQVAKPFKALSNGSIVTCYFVNDGTTITIYRPNPNAKEVYKPLSLEEHIAHRKIYGCY